MGFEVGGSHVDGGSESALRVSTTVLFESVVVAAVLVLPMLLLTGRLGWNAYPSRAYFESHLLFVRALMLVAWLTPPFCGGIALGLRNHRRADIARLAIATAIAAVASVVVLFLAFGGLTGSSDTPPGTYWTTLTLQFAGFYVVVDVIILWVGVAFASQIRPTV